jgi:hypothetical protein
MTNIKKSFTSRIPERSTTAAKFAALGAGFGSLFGRKAAVLFGGIGAYCGSRMGERAERKQFEEAKEEAVDITDTDDEVVDDVIEQAE